MTDPDIVTGLRTDAALFGKMPPHAKVNMNPEFMREMSQLWIAAANEIERLREERDEARRIACEMEERLGCDESGYPKNGLAQDHAKRRGWDCFKEDTDE